MSFIVAAVVVIDCRRRRDNNVTINNWNWLLFGSAALKIYGRKRFIDVEIRVLFAWIVDSIIVAELMIILFAFATAINLIDRNHKSHLQFNTNNHFPRRANSNAIERIEFLHRQKPIYQKPIIALIRLEFYYSISVESSFDPLKMKMILRDSALFSQPNCI